MSEVGGERSADRPAGLGSLPGAWHRGLQVFRVHESYSNGRWSLESPSQGLSHMS